MKKKILFIIWSYTWGGGAEALLTMIVNHLNPEKYDISIIEYEHAGYKVEKVNSNIHVLPPIEKIETPDHQKKGYQVYHTPEILIDKYIKSDFDLYVSFNYQIPTFLLPKGTRNISWIHGDVYDLSGEDAKREWGLQDKAFDKVEKIVAISDRTYQSLYELFPRHREKIIKLYNGIDIYDVRNKAKKDTDIILSKPSILFSGRLDENKNPLRLLEIFQLVLSQKPSAQLYFMGEGSQKDILKEKIENLKLVDSVHILEYQQNPFPIIRQACVTCLVSKSEGFSVSLMESVALGIPFVSTDVGGAELLTNNEKCGRVINTDEEATDAIIELLDADKEQIKHECEESIKRFSIDEYISKIESLFDFVINEK